MVKMGKYDEFLRFLDVRERDSLFLHFFFDPFLAPRSIFSPNDSPILLNASPRFDSSIGGILLPKVTTGSQRGVGVALGGGMRPS